MQKVRKKNIFFPVSAWNEKIQLQCGWHHVNRPLFVRHCAFSFSDHLTRGGIFSLPTFPRILRTVRIVTKVCLDNRFGIFVLLDFSWRIFRRVERDSSSMITFQSSDGVAIISRRSQKVYTRSLGRCPRSSQKNCHESEWTRMLDGADCVRSHLKLHSCSIIKKIPGDWFPHCLPRQTFGSFLR